MIMALCPHCDFVLAEAEPESIPPELIAKVGHGLTCPNCGRSIDILKFDARSSEDPVAQHRRLADHILTSSVPGRPAARKRWWRRRT